MTVLFIFELLNKNKDKNTMGMSENIWMGLVEISPQADNSELEQHQSAFTSVLLFAEGADDYTKKIEQYLNKEKFNLLSLTDVASYTELVEEYEFDEDIEEAAEFLEETNKPQMTVLQIFNKEE